MASKETSTRGTGKGGKLPSGTEDQLIKDLQRVHKLFPNTEPDRDFYRAHGRYTDAAWKEHFSRFKVFVAEAGLLPPFRQACYFLDRIAEELQQGWKDFSEQEREIIHEKMANFEAMLTARIESQRAVRETLAAMAEEERLESEESKGA